ncbi:hypothetical protein EYF80_010773 [Liparis tanakae]|uniref:Uncharacterized protein n=1 Tax=Liparis tanakae TaxID=230148 RepID=A0A4Z2INR7_9TELE|nr:hypothetical protein EYF80_010773 [Liparis tanakae]
MGNSFGHVFFLCTWRGDSRADETGEFTGRGSRSKVVVFMNAAPRLDVLRPQKFTGGQEVTVDPE